MRIVILGATGNLGTSLLSQLRGSGHQIHGVVRRPPRAQPPYDGVTWHRLDVSEPGAAAALAPVLAGADAVVNLVWGFQPTRDADYLERVGVGGTRAVLDAATAAGVGHLVQLSSVGAYSPGARGVRVDESWPTSGAADFTYSRHKAAMERLLDSYEHEHPSGMVVTRVRPGLVVQRAAAGALLRYGAPGWFVPGLLRYVALLPLDRTFLVPVIHADDVATALVAIVERRAGGAFNLAAEPPVTRQVLAELLGARPVTAPRSLLRSAAALSWRLRLQPVDPGWVDLAFAVPLLDTGRARALLDWQPRFTSREAIADLLAGMVAGAGAASPALRPRTVGDELSRAARQGRTSDRQVP